MPVDVEKNRFAPCPSDIMYGCRPWRDAYEKQAAALPGLRSRTWVRKVDSDFVWCSIPAWVYFWWSSALGEYWKARWSAERERISCSKNGWLKERVTMEVRQRLVPVM